MAGTHRVVIGWSTPAISGFPPWIEKGRKTSDTTVVNAWAASKPGADYEPFQHELGPIGDDEVEVQVTHCDICHSDLSMRNNAWGFTRYPFVGGHEIEGRVVRVGSDVEAHAVGDRVGVGWFSRSHPDCPY